MPTEIEEIKHIRKKLGITQSELSKLSGVSQSLIAKIEAGKIDPTYSRARRLFEALQQLSGHEELIARDIANTKIISVSPQHKISEAIKLMKKYDISQLPVITGQHAVGRINETLLLDCVLKGKTDERINECMGESPPVVPDTANIQSVSDLLKFYSLILVNQKGKLIGLITKSDVIQNAYKKK